MHAGASLDFSMYLVTPTSAPSSLSFSPGPSLVQDRVRAARIHRRSQSVDQHNVDLKSTDLLPPLPALDVHVSSPRVARNFVIRDSEPGKAPTTFPGFSTTSKSSQSHPSRKKWANADFNLYFFFFFPIVYNIAHTLPRVNLIDVGPFVNVKNQPFMIFVEACSILLVRF